MSDTDRPWPAQPPRLMTAPEGPPSPAVAYVMTHFPRLAMTFITDEVHQIEATGGRIVPIAMNSPGDADLSTATARSDRDRTMYVKARGARRLAWNATRFAVAHPMGFARLAVRAIRSGGTDPAIVGRRLVHLCEAVTVAEHARRNGVRHLHAHFGQAPATIAWFAAAIGNIDEPGQWSWSFTIHGFQDFVDEAVARLDLKARDAAFVVCISDFTKSQLCRITDPALWDRFVVLRCGIDLDAFAPRSSRPLREVPRISVVGRLSPEKGHIVLLRAVAMLRDRGVAVELEIIGGGPFEGELLAEQSRLRLDDRVVHRGELLPAAVREQLADADIFCLPSFSEGLPLSIMEAMAIGVPVVATGISGIPELAINGETALTVPPGNVQSLADALQLMITDDEMRTRLVEQASITVRRRHDLVRNVAALADRLRLVQ